MRRVRGDIPKTSLILLYKTLVEPYFRYCNTTWRTCNSSLLDRLQVLQNRVQELWPMLNMKVLITLNY